MEAYVKRLAVSAEKSAPFVEKEELYLDESGIEGDRHNSADNQVSIFSYEALMMLSDEPLGLCTERYNCNILSEGINLSKLKCGSVISIGSAKLMITAKKKCFYEDCKKARQGASCALLENALYAKVLTPAKIYIKDMINIED